MAFIRVKKRRGRRYAYLVESVWTAGATSPRQRVIKYLGAEERAQIDDVPAEYRDEPAVRRWFASRSQDTVGVPDEELGTLRRELREAVRDPDRAALDALAAAGSQRMGVWGYMQDVVAPVLHEVGDEWHEGVIDVADEHVATRAIADLLRRLRDEEALRTGRRPTPGRLVLLLANPEGEEHSVALDVLECRLAQLGHRTTVLAGGLPRRDLAQRARQLDADVVLLSATMSENVDEAVQAAHAVVDRAPRAFVVLGGQAWDGAPQPTDAHPRMRVLAGRVGNRLDALLRELEIQRTAGEASA